MDKIILIIHIRFLNKTIMQQTPNPNPCFESNHKVQSSKLRSTEGRLLPTGRKNVQSQGRTELAQRYFPYIMPKSAWEKLRSLLLEDPDLAYLTKLKHRTFLPAEVNIIYQHLGQPWAALLFSNSLILDYLD